MSEVFTTTAIFDLSLYDGENYFGLEAIINMMEVSVEHPLAHHASNMVINVEDEMVSVILKRIGVVYKVRVGSVVYRDKLSNIDGAWCISEHLLNYVRQLVALTQTKAKLLDRQRLLLGAH